MPVTIIGAGRMAAAIGSVLARGGVATRFLARRPEAARERASAVGAAWGVLGEPLVDELIVLAVPPAALADVRARYEGQWAGRIVVDASGPAPLDAAESATTVGLQHDLPDARVVKAFATTFAEALVADARAGAAPVVLVAGDDAEACERVVGMLQAGDLAAVSVGALDQSPALDALATLQHTLAADGVISRRGGFALRY
jgi:8-hydroxy-5-deazaflavin:NADPH oxidoreductase